MTVAAPTNVIAARAARARELATRYEYAADPLRLVAALADAQARVFEHALADRPARDDLASYVVDVSLPGVMDAAVAEGTEYVRESVLLRFHHADLAGVVEGWLRGEEQEPVDVFLARAATSPVLEALSALAATLKTVDDPRRCLVCGGLPQLAVFAEGPDALATGPRRLVCARCAAEWTYPRMACVSCGESGGANMPILADEARIPHLRVDACDTCRAYLVTVDRRKDPRAIPVVDEIVALPLDLIASERGYTKITRNLVGF